MQDDVERIAKVTRALSRSVSSSLMSAITPTGMPLNITRELITSPVASSELASTIGVLHVDALIERAEGPEEGPAPRTTVNRPAVVSWRSASRTSSP